MSQPVRFERRGPIAWVTLDRPETRNAVSDLDVVEGLEAACAEAAADPKLRVMVLTATDPAFSSGGNLREMHEGTGMFAGDAAALRDGYRGGIQRIPRALWDLELPTIAAVNGPAVGAGCDLTLMCDIRVASERARFAESFVKVGLIPGDGGAFFLPRAVGWSRAAEMAFTGDAVDAQTALEWGLVSRVVPHEELHGAAEALALRIAANPPRALRLTKRLLREAQHQRLGELLELSAAFQTLAHQDPDHREAVAAFLEKRPPRFGGGE